MPFLSTNAPVTRRRVTAAFALAAILLLVVGSITVWGLERIAAARGDRQDAVVVRDRLNRLLVHFQDAETGQRGFLLTGQEPYLRPFETGSALVRSDLDTLVQLTAPDSAVAGRVRTLTPAIEAKLSELSLTVSLRRSRGLDAALRVVLTDQGRLLMDSVRQIARGIGAIENGRYTDAGALVQRTTTWVEASSVIGTLLAMGFLGLAGLVQRRDSQSQEEAERQLAEMSTELKDLYEQAPCGYHTLDLDGLIVRMNQTECRWLGYQLDEVIGKKTVFDILVAEDRTRARERFQRLVGGDDIGTGEARFVRKDGTRLPVVVSSSVVRDATGAPWRVRATMMDETAFRGAREQVDRLNAQLQRHVAELEDLNQELEKFSYSISHDLRAPLRAISGFARLLLQEHAANLDPEGARLLGVIRVNTERMGRLIDDLLSLSRFSRQPLVRTPMDMAALVSGVIVDRAAAQAPGGAEIVVANLPDADGDAALLKQVWERLIDNGVKFTEGIKAPRVEIGARADNGTTVYSVRDNGVGFDMQYAAKVFEVFQRLHPQSDYEGTGVGLAIVQRVIHRHGGRIWAESAPGQGATFFFTLGAKGGAG
ncbi:MAG TPA: CHASE3 domain-containing protein [Gemmatimonadales bacterium]|nr:CHASE3 domain-containing protein [Gemmatimonadales bacterium]